MTNSPKFVDCRAPTPAQAHQCGATGLEPYLADPR